MNKIKPIVWKIAYNLGRIIIGIQAALAVLWVLKNLWLVPDFPETIELLEMSETWVLDEYVGAAYVALVFVTQMLQKWIGIPFQMLLYLLQLSLGIFAIYRLLRLAFWGKREGEGCANLERRKLFLTSVYVNSIPFLLQAHMAVLPYSLAGSIYFLLVAELISLCKWAKSQEELKDKRGLAFRMCAIVVLWTLSALILPEYRLLSGAVVVVCVLYAGIPRKKLQGWLVLGVAIGALFSGLFVALTTEEGSRGRIQNTFESQAMRRFAWPHLETMESVWPWDVVVFFSEEELGYASVTPERAAEDFGPRMEELFGKETANEYYGKMAKTALLYNTRVVLDQLGKDLSFYICPQWSALLDLRGLGATYTGQNYERLQESSAELTKLFVKWSEISMVALFLLTMIGLRKSKVDKMWLGAMVFSWALQVLHCTWTTGGMVNYLESPINLAIWGMLMATWLWAGEERGADSK